MRHITSQFASAERASEQLLLELQALQESGAGDEPEADSLRERLGQNWNELSVAARDRVRELSGDLYMLLNPSEEGYVSAQPGAATAELSNSYLSGHVERALGLLRTARPADFSVSQVAYLRGRCWSRLGYKLAGAAFLELASGQDPGNSRLQYLSLIGLIDAGAEDRALKKAEEINMSTAATPTELIGAAHVFFHHAQTTNSLADYQRVAELISVATKEAQPVSQGLLILAWVEQGFAYEHWGRRVDADAAYSRALSLKPQDPYALTVRGLLRFRLADGRSLADFEAAIRSRADVVWPYIVVANQRFAAGRYLDCANTCREGLGAVRGSEFRAKLHERLATALASLSAPPSEVENEFSAALELAPFDRRIRDNLDLYRAATPPQGLLPVEFDPIGARLGIEREYPALEAA